MPFKKSTYLSTFVCLFVFRARSETEKALQKKTEELNSQEQQIIALNEENEKTSQIKERLEKDISTLKNAAQTSVAEIKRLSGAIGSKDIEIENLKSDLASLSSHLQQLKEVHLS